MPRRSASLIRPLLASIALLPASFAFLACSTVTPGAPSCDLFMNEEPEPTLAVTWRFVNATSQPIFLAPAQGCSSVEAGYLLTGPEGTPVVTESDVCGGSCEVLHEQGQVACAADCAVPPIRALPPGTAWEHVWEATEWATASMPNDCVAEDGFGADEQDGPQDVDCRQRLVAESGQYEISLDAYSACVSGVDMLCTCATTDADGTCRVSDGFSSELKGKKLSAKTTFSVPAAGVVEVRFEGDLCQPSSSTTPCMGYGADGCCQGETCLEDNDGVKRCSPVSAP